MKVKLSAGVELKAKAKIVDWVDNICFEFGPVQAGMDISSKGTAARKLKLKDGDKVKITIEKV